MRTNPRSGGEFILNVFGRPDSVNYRGLSDQEPQLKFMNAIISQIFRIFFRSLFSAVCLIHIRKSAQWEKMLPEGADSD